MDPGLVASIDLIIGPMGSGKTSELLRRLETYSRAKRRVILIKPSHDTRTDMATVGTHGFRSASAITFSKLMDASKHLMVQGAAVVCIDEGQFFPDLVEGSEELAKQGKKVIIAALNGDSDQKCFVPMIEMAAKCEDITKLFAVCAQCGMKAAFTAHRGNKSEVVEIGDIGENGAYVPLCRACLMNWKEASAQQTK